MSLVKTKTIKRADVAKDSIPAGRDNAPVVRRGRSPALAGDGGSSPHPRAPAIVQKWKRLLAVGCSHGIHADPKAINAVLRFREAFKPDACIHLGDFCDTTAFRSGAKGTNDEAEPIQPDVDGGLEFLDALAPTLVFCGNHEDRLFRLANSPNAIVSHCAHGVINEIYATCQRLKAQLVEWSGIEQGRIIGGYRFMHGVFFNENATRDHAEAFGNVVHAHTHRAGVAKGRRSDSPTGYAVGTLTRRGAMEYAKTRRATMAWSGGFVWGEYTDHEAVLWLHEQPSNLAEWRLPK